LCRKEVDGSVVSLHQILKKNLLRQIWNYTIFF
jgi:hypothetical protein